MLVVSWFEVQFILFVIGRDFPETVDQLVFPALFSSVELSQYVRLGEKVQQAFSVPGGLTI